MDGGQALFAFWAGADEPQTREGRVGGLWGRSIDFSGRTQMSASGLTAILTPRVILLFLERSFEPPTQLMLAQPERGGR